MSAHTQIALETEAPKKLAKDLLKATAELTPREVRYLVDTYYQMQDNRIRAGNQVRALSASGEPHDVINWFLGQSEHLEGQVKRALKAYAESQTVGRWALSIVGIGPVITAGLLAHIDIEKAPTVGHIWRFAGLDPTMKWLGSAAGRELVTSTIDAEYEPDEYALSEEEQAELAEVLGDGSSQLNSQQLLSISRMTGRKFGNLLRLARDEKGRITKESLIKVLAKRPWNASLKVLCWKASESFVKTCNNEKSFYGPIYIARKAQETEKNERGDFATQATAALTKKRYGKDTEAYKAYSQGKLPLAHIHRRATRYTVKLFLAHLHDKLFWDRFNEAPPKPYPIEHLGHVHYIAPPE